MKACRVALVFWLGSLVLLAQPAILPLAEVKPGMRGTGRTIFSGSRIETFEVEILGTMLNIAPKQSVILARLSGGGLEKSGVMQGMSGSPVYINGKLVGAVALSFPFAKEPIAGIRPIEEMLAVPIVPTTDRSRIALASPEQQPRNLAALLPPVQTISSGNMQLADIATPFWFSGFTKATVDWFAPELRRAGLEPVQGIGGGGSPVPGMGSTAKLEPGSMISVQLITGDLSAGADGTVTHVDGNRVYAFGHRFLSAGTTDLPFARADVIAVLPNQQLSFKISSPREWMGSILEDRAVTIAGQLGRKARMIPLEVSVNNPDSKRSFSYRMDLAHHRWLTPVLLQMAIFSAVDATERAAGVSTITLDGTLDLNGQPPVRIQNVFSAELGTPQVISASVAAPLAYLMQSDFESLQVRGVKITLSVLDRKNVWEIENLVPSHRTIRPGETISFAVQMLGENGAEMSRTVQYTVPVGAPTGQLYFTVADGLTANLSDYRQYFLNPPKTPSQMIAYLNGQHSNAKAYLRVWRAHPAFQVQSLTLPDPPPSAALLLSRLPQTPANSLVTELEIPVNDGMVSGTKTVQVEVKE